MASPSRAADTLVTAGRQPLGPPAATLPPAEAGLGAREPRVLVVDDEAPVRDLLVDCLGAAGYCGTGAGTPGEALGLLRQRAFEVMLCDLLMPQMGGVELMARARVEAPDTSVIVVTAVGDVETAIRAMRLGAYDYMVKPISPGDVVLRVASAIEMRRHVVEARCARQRLEEQHRQLEQAASLKDDLVQMLVHDLKSPLASAMGYIELLGTQSRRNVSPGQGNFSERQSRYLQQAYASCKDVLRMTTTLLDVTRMEKGVLELRREPLDVPPLLREAAAEVEPLIAASGGTIEVECDPAAGAPFADRELMHRVLSNLLANAAKYTPGAARIRVGVGPGEGRCALVFVADNGAGIPTEEQQAIFRKYHQLPSHRGTGGAGIGLAFCRMAVEAHGGRIWVESAAGQGSTFRFTLPLAPGAPPPTSTGGRP